MILLDQEFSYYGITLKQLLAAGKQVHWIEFGVGGGTSPTGDAKATDAISAAETPFFGGLPLLHLPCKGGFTSHKPQQGLPHTGVMYLKRKIAQQGMHARS